MLTLNRSLKVMSVDLARPAMAYKLFNRHSGRPGRVLAGTDEGGSLFGGGAPRFFWWWVRRLGLGYTYPVGGAYGSPLGAVGP